MSPTSDISVARLSRPDAVDIRVGGRVVAQLGDDKVLSIYEDQIIEALGPDLVKTVTKGRLR